MKILIACEKSGVVRDAFTALGHNAWSCDIEPSEAPGQHLLGDVLRFLDDDWDMMIAHPPCTYLTATGNKWFYHPDDKHLPTAERRPHPRFPDRRRDQEMAIEFFMALANSDIPRIVIENPVGVMSSVWRKPDQIFHPYHFGAPYPKKTCLWLKNTPNLVHTHEPSIAEIDEMYHTTRSGKRMPKVDWLR